MRQGMGKTVTAIKREPNVHIVNPKGVSQIGQALGNHIPDGQRATNVAEPLYGARGFEAPSPKGMTVHNGGSQGRR
jgi:hypothetical protein